MDITQTQKQAHDKMWLPLLERFTMSSTEQFWTFETDKAAHSHITSYAEVWARSLKVCRVGEKLYTQLWQAPAPALTGPSELVCEGLTELLLQVLSTAQICDSYDPTVIHQQWVKVAEHVLCQYRANYFLWIPE